MKETAMFKRDQSLKITNADTEWHPRYIEVVGCLYICALFLSWITAGKLFAAGPFVLSASILIYPLTCIFGDVLTEIYGFNRTRRLIWMGFICGMMFLFFTQLTIALPPAADYKFQEAFAAIHGQMPRMVFASYIAYLCCEFTNSYIMSKMKVWSEADNFPLRAIASTAAAQLVDSTIFMVIAFVGTVPAGSLLFLVINTWIGKTLYEAALLPLTSAFVHRLKTLEGIEHFDHGTLQIMKF